VQYSGPEIYCCRTKGLKGVGFNRLIWDSVSRSEGRGRSVMSARTESSSPTLFIMYLLSIVYRGLEG